MASVGAMISQKPLSNPLRPVSPQMPDPQVNHINRQELPSRNRLSDRSNPSTSIQQSAMVHKPSGDGFAVSLPLPHGTSWESPVTGSEMQNKWRMEQRTEIRDSEMEDWEDGEDSVSRSFTDFSPHEVEVQSKSNNLIAMPLKQLVYPKSQYEGYQPPFPVCKERVAVDRLRKEISRAPSLASRTEPFADHSAFEEILLSDFSVYHPSSSTHRPFELQGLQNLTLYSNSSFMFDGVLSVGENRRYVERVAFEICSIGHYGQDHHEVGSAIWIQSKINSREDVYYKLGTPSTEYARYHQGFLWLADLAKHFVDYCHASEGDVLIQNFRSDFSRWMQVTHTDSITFQAWYRCYKSSDFRQAVSRNIEFLFKESIGVDEKLRSQPIWGELLVQDSQFLKCYPMKETKTIVTP